MFSPSCISHTVLTKRSWAKVTVDGVSLPDALQCWVEQEQPGERPLVSEEEAQDSMLLAQKYSKAHFNDYLRPVQADSPQESFKRFNSNLVKSIDRYQSNSMGHRTKKLRHKPNIVHNRTNRRNRNKRHKSKRCQYGKSLGAKIRCAKEENELRHKMRDEVVDLNEVERSNRDLIRSIQRGEIPRAERQRRRRRRKRQRSGEPKLGREERRKLRREEKRRLKQELKRRKRQEERSRQGRKLRSPQLLSFAQLSEHFSREQRRHLSTRSTRSASSGQCKLKHVDVCNWPQCNRSCPKLHNPLTGKDTS